MIDTNKLIEDIEKLKRKGVFLNEHEESFNMGLDEAIEHIQEIRKHSEPVSGGVDEDVLIEKMEIAIEQNWDADTEPYSLAQRCFSAIRPYLKQPTPADETLRDAKDFIENLLSIANHSDGVAGYHRNGEIANWGEFNIRGDAEHILQALSQPSKPAINDKILEALEYWMGLEEDLEPNEPDQLAYWHECKAILSSATKPAMTRGELGQLVYNTLSDYTLAHQVVEDGENSPLPLADALTHKTRSIADGKEEIDNITDNIITALAEAGVLNVKKNEV